MAKIASPLRYPGGKSALSGFIKLLFSQNDLLDGEYIEPYCGGAGVAMELLKSEFASRVHLNDVDPAVYSFWWAVFNQPDELCSAIRSAKLTVANWRRQKAVWTSPQAHSRLELGFATFFLNRVNRSGILSAGPIGGFEQNGNWDMSARFNRDALIPMIESLSLFKDRVLLTQQDACDFLRDVVRRLPKKSLIYLDPPYVVKGQRLYLNAYGPDDHSKIAEAVQGISKVPWVVSYDNVELIRSLYANRRNMVYDIGYSASIRSVGSEIIVFSDGLTVPNVHTPVSIHGTKLRQLLAA